MLKKGKKDIKDEIITFLESEDAPKLLYGFGQVFGKGLFAQAGGLNPMKGNINIMGIKIPKAIAFGFAQKMGWLPNIGVTEQTPEGGPVSPQDPFGLISQAQKGNK